MSVQDASLAVYLAAGEHILSDYDSPWKEALDVYFELFMAFFFSRGPCGYRLEPRLRSARQGVAADWPRKTKLGGGTSINW